MGGPGGDLPNGMSGLDGNLPGGDISDGVPSGMGGMPNGNLPNGGLPDGGPDRNLPDGRLPDGGPNGKIVGTPDGGTTQSATGSGDSTNYESFSDMVAAYRADIEEVYAGDKYEKNIVSLYNPLNYTGAAGTEDPTWTKIVMSASEGDMSMFSSLNLQIAWLNAGVDAVIEWQWDGGHVPSEIFGNSLALYVDQMYGEYVAGAVTVTKTAAAKQTANGASDSATGTNLSSWVSYSGGNVSFTLAAAAAYRTRGASKAMPGFDVINYAQGGLCVRQR